MFQSPNIKRLKQLDLSKVSIGDEIMYCPDCEFQEETNTAGKAICDCGTRKHIITVTEELILIKNEFDPRRAK